MQDAKKRQRIDLSLTLIRGTKRAYCERAISGITPLVRRHAIDNAGHGFCQTMQWCGALFFPWKCHDFTTKSLAATEVMPAHPLKLAVTAHEAGCSECCVPIKLHMQSPVSADRSG